jgi:mono/diheme cytochrome c family protein
MRIPWSPQPPHRAWIFVLALAASATLAVGGSVPAPSYDVPATVGQTASVVRQAAPPAGRAERMLESRLACLGCHVIDGRGGRIGPSLDDLAQRVDAGHVRAMITDPAATIPGTIMPRQRVPDRDLGRLVAYLMEPRSGPGEDVVQVTPQAPPAPTSGSETDGAALYARHCAACHGDNGAGDGWNAPTLPVQPTAHADSEAMSARTDDALFDAIYAGAFVLDGSPRMPPFGLLLSRPQIRTLVAHIRELCQCAQPAWAGAP